MGKICSIIMIVLICQTTTPYTTTKSAPRPPTASTVCPWTAHSPSWSIPRTLAVSVLLPRSPYCSFGCWGSRARTPAFCDRSWSGSCIRPVEREYPRTLFWDFRRFECQFGLACLRDHRGSWLVLISFFVRSSWWRCVCWSISTWNCFSTLVAEKARSPGWEWPGWRYSGCAVPAIWPSTAEPRVSQGPVGGRSPGSRSESVWLSISTTACCYVMAVEFTPVMCLYNI